MTDEERPSSLDWVTCAGLAAREMDREASEQPSSPLRPVKKRKREDSPDAKDSDAQDHEETTRSAKKGRFIDPVLQKSPTLPVILILCGHTVDASYLNELNKTAHSRGYLKGDFSAGYVCPICNAFSVRAIRNFALEEEMGLNIDASTHPLNLLDVPELQRRRRFKADSDDLADSLALIGKARFQEYHDVTERLMHDIIMPEIKATCRDTHYHNGVVHRASIIHTSESLRHIFPDRDAFFKWYSYDRHRHEKELYDNHLVKIKITFWLLNQALMKQKRKKGDSDLWFSKCERSNVYNDWTNAGLRFDYTTREDRINTNMESDEEEEKEEEEEEEGGEEEEEEEEAW